MTPQPSTPSGRPTLRFVALPEAALVALTESDLARASALVGVELTDYFVTDQARWVWDMRIGQLRADPGEARWIARAAVDEPAGVVVGMAGFHGQPDERGMVEISYSVDPAFRRRGYARAMLRELLRRSGAEPAVEVVRATISPDNEASLATLSGFGFAEVGEQWDDIDGLELIFEVPAADP